MKFSLSWLKEFLETDASVQIITDTLTKIGLEVESTANPGKALADFTTAKIIEANPHPDADRLQICKVDTGNEVLQIVCGAPNARAGLHVALASVGTLIPAGNFKIKQSKIRGVESCGMLCSAAELGLGEDSAGIIELPECNLGQPIAPVLGLDDTIIEVGLTPNRGDCFGVYGIARDLAAAEIGTLKTLNYKKIETESISLVELKTPLCTAFAVLKIEQVRNTPAPNWMQQRLKVAGKTSHGLLIDATNYSAFSYVRPLHAFDADKVQGKLVVLEANGGELFLGLDDVEYTVPKGAIVIADDSGIISLAGIMGGKSTAVTDETTNILLESAVFDAGRIALIGQALNIHTDARQRFERGIDAAFTEPGLWLAAQQVGGIATGYQLAGVVQNQRDSIDYDYKALKRLSGLDIPEEKSLGTLKKLGFQPQGDTLLVPSWRHDLSGPFAAGGADWVEEVLRIVGYDRIPVVTLPPQNNIKKPVQKPVQNSVQPHHKARETLKAQHWQEVLTYTFLAPKMAELFNSNIELANPISQDLSFMRASLLPNLLEAAKRSQTSSQNSGGKLFEFGAVFSSDSQQEAKQQENAAGVLWGNEHEDHWQQRARAFNTFDAKAAALSIVQHYGLEAASLQTSIENLSKWYHPNQSGYFMLGNKPVGQFGMLHPGYAKTLDLADQPVALFELYLENIPSRQPKKKAFVEQKLQAVQRDLAFVVANDILAENLVKLAKGANQKFIKNVDIFDVYSGKGVEEGKKSLAIRLTLQPDQQTFTDEDINAITEMVIDKISQKTGGVLRG